MTRATITLYGGVNEIGGNKFLLEEGDHRLLLDFGTSIGARGLYYDEYLTPRTNAALRDLLRLGLLPDIPGVYRHDFLTVARSATDKDLPESAEEHHRRHGRFGVDGILLTHAHVDHFQDLAYVDPRIPVYTTRTTLAMLRAISDCTSTGIEGEITTVRPRSVGRTTKRSTFAEQARVETATPEPRAFHTVDDGATFDVGAFKVQAVPVDHSVPGGCAYLVRTPAGKRVFYTGDVRFHGRLLDRTSRLLDAMHDLAPDVLLSEGTRIASDDRDGEEDVERSVRDLVADTPGLIVSEFAWKDTTRFDTLQRVAEATGRKLLVNPRLAYLLRALDGHQDVPSHRIEAYPHVGVYLKRKENMLGAPHDWDKHEVGYDVDWGERSTGMKKAWEAEDDAFLSDRLALWRNRVTDEDIHAHPERYMVHLSYWDVGALFDLAPDRDARWIRCATEPYNDDMVMNLARQERWLDHFGMQHAGVTGERDPDLLGGRIHVSGHGAGVDLKDLIKRTSPKLLVPVHTEEKSLDHFEDLGHDATLFRGTSFRHAAKGACVVEF